jgi:pimeloyl-ACP methyl ester carboxylesterase
MTSIRPVGISEGPSLMPSANLITGDAGPHLDPGAGLTEQFVALPDGRRLRAVVAGDGDGPLVVFEAGMSAPAASWVHTQREISLRARTVSYDRAGYGGSDPDPHDRTLERCADDLAGLLDGLGETQPVVFVGHSWGGPIIRVFAQQFPRRVAGLVFVDATLAEVMPARSARVIATSFAVMAMLARFGGKGLIRKVTLPHGSSPEITKADMDIMFRDYACTQAMRAGGREAKHILAGLPTMRSLQTAGTPDVPTICLQGGRIDRGMKKARPLFNRAAAELTAKMSNGRTIVVEGSGHLLPQENPVVVREAILEVVGAVAVTR